MVRITPTLPLVAPPSVRNARACQKLLEKPKPKHDKLVPRSPINRTDLRPARGESAIRPHIMAVTNWAAMKLAWRMPAWLEMDESGSEGSNDLSW